MLTSRAPLRITLGGGGTDLPSYYSKFGGYFISAAINQYIYICLNSSRIDDSIKLKYSEYESVLNVDAIQHPLFRESLKFFAIKNSMEIASLADIPSGTGMGSSGSFLVALIAALKTFKGESFTPAELAEAAFEIEVNRLKMPVGKQDPYVSAFGGICSFEISPQGEVTVRPLAISARTLDELRGSMLLFYTGIRRRSRDVLVHQKEQTDKNSAPMIENLHQIKEVGRQIEKALVAGDIEQVGALMHRHWEIKRARTESISNSQIDGWYATAMDKGALGGKIMGAGGGGFLLMICTAPSARQEIVRCLEGEGLVKMEFEFDNEGARVL